MDIQSRRNTYVGTYIFHLGKINIKMASLIAEGAFYYEK